MPIMNAKALLPIESAQDLFQVGQVAAQSGIFGEINPAAGTMIIMTCYQERISPLDFIRRYDVINGKIAKKAKYMLCEFVQSGGRYHIETYTDEEVEITFSFRENTQKITVTLRDMVDRGIAIGKGGQLKENWKKHPRRMLFARCVSEGVGIVCPGITVGIYTPEEVSDFTSQNVPLPSAGEPEEPMYPSLIEDAPSQMRILEEQTETEIIP